MDEPGSSESLKQAQAGDAAAFRRLVEPHLRRLRNLAVRMLGNPDDAQEAVQESLLRASNGLDGFRQDAQFIDANETGEHSERWRWLSLRGDRFGPHC